MKFGSTMHRSISHPNLTGDQMLKTFENPRLWMVAILKIEKSRDHQMHLADFAEFFNDDTY